MGGVFPSLSGAGTVGGFLPRLFIPTISPSGLPEVEVEKGCYNLQGTLFHWEELSRVSVFYRRQQLSDPGAPLLLPHRPEHQVCRPRVSGGTTAASWAHGVVGREGVVLLSGPLTADSQEVLAALGTGRSRSRIRPLPAAVHPPAPA